MVIDFIWPGRNTPGRELENQETRQNMSTARIKLTGQTACYHCIGRAVGAEHLFGDVEKEILTGMLWKLAGFCGMEVITY